LINSESQITVDLLVVVVVVAAAPLLLLLLLRLVGPIFFFLFSTSSVHAVADLGGGHAPPQTPEVALCPDEL